MANLNDCVHLKMDVFSRFTFLMNKLISKNRCFGGLDIQLLELLDLPPVKHIPPVQWFGADVGVMGEDQALSESRTSRATVWP